MILLGRFSFQLLLACLLGLLPVAGCNQEAAVGWQGYAEGEYLYIAASRGGRLVELEVQKGDTVKAGTPLFRLDPEPESATLGEARYRLKQAEASRNDLVQGERPSEIEALQARRAQVLADRDLAKRQLERHQSLLAGNAISREQYDKSRAELKRKEAELSELDARIVTARLGGRADQLRALSAAVDAASETVQQAEWALAQKSPVAPAAALVFDTIFEPGELVPANSPVVVLLPDNGRKARFYVAEEELASLQLGNKVRLNFDGGELTATISYISPQAEYTPPVIYSRETRSKLVYLVEAHPDPNEAEQLKPGQPLEVFLQ